jgi:two-component system phosphate regulon sensor histidine kinase PhoR
LEPLPSDNVPFLPLVGALNECVAAAESAVGRAREQAKELEIELKVATGQREHAEAVINSIGDAVIVTDLFDDVLLCNEAAGDALGFDAAAANRRPLAGIVTDDNVVNLISQMRQGGQTHGRRSTEIDIFADDRATPYKVTLGPVADSSGRLAGVVAVLQNLTREREAAKAKNDFVGSVTHELRTPLSSINAYVEMLLDGEGEDPDTRREFCEIIQTEADRLGKLIDNILNISRIESGLVKVDRKPLSPVMIAKDALEVIRPTAGVKNIEVIDRLPPSLSQIEGDRDMLYQAVLNLLGNAVKYTPEGGRVEIEVTTDADAKLACIKVSDTGIGIPQADIEKVFEKFYRVKANESAAVGTGLGLPLVKHVVEEVHAGRVVATSEVGVGSTFTLELPLAA